MSRSKTGAVAAGLFILVLATQPCAAISIQFDYSLDNNNFFNTQAKKDVLTAAADVFEAAFTDDLEAITPGPSGFGFDNTWTALISHPATGTQTSEVDLTIAADEILVFAGGRNLGGSTLGVGGPGGFSASGTQEFLDTVKARGELGALNAGSPTDFGPWGGSIAFDTLTTWNVSVISGPSGGESDLLSVALHELAHLMGIGTASSWDNLVSGSFFVGPDSVAEHGSSVPLDGIQSHWAAGTMSTVNGSTQEAAMDPTLTVGTRKHLTDLDFAGLSDTGWELISEPGDMDGNGLLDVDDIDDFELALSDPVAYTSLTGLDPDIVGDMDGNGTLTPADVDNFINVLNGLPNPGPGTDTASTVPEPSSLVLASLVLLGLVGYGRRR